MSNEELIAEARSGYSGQEWVKDHHPHSAVGLALRLADALEAAQPKTVSTHDELLMLEPGAVIRGPQRNGEVYVKGSYVDFWAPGSVVSWNSFSLMPRGPFTVLFTPPATETENT
jgi:hypothetical protein